VPSLAETQSQFRAALDGQGRGVLPLLGRVPDAAARLAIYQRHHRQSLVRHLRGRFPTVEWLLGSDATEDLARAFIVAHPPTAPCMAEYGEPFPAFVAASHAGRRFAYLAPAARLDWWLGQTAVAVDMPAIAIDTLASIPPEQLPELRLILQPGVRYLDAAWPVDELVQLRLADRPPQSYRLDPLSVCLEITGARGAFRIGRIDRPTLIFRATLAAGGSIGAAAGSAFAADRAFDAGGALASLFAASLVCAVVPPATGA
jgi:hypothetical protein